MVDKNKKTNITRYYSDEDVLNRFYDALLNEEISRVHIPRSDVFYVREAIRQQTGITYTLDHVERAMLAEGMLEPEDCFEPERKRDFGYGEPF